MATFAEIREAAAESDSQVLVGTVTATSPLSVQFGNVIETTDTVLVRAAGYEPAVNDEVICQRVGNFYVVLDRLGAASDWVDWTPSFTNLTLGNGTVSARYKQMGTTVHFHVLVVFGSTTSISGLVTCSVPVTMQNLSYGDTFTAMGRDNTAGYFKLATTRSSTSAFQIVALTASAAYVTIASLSSTVPFTWAATDRITVSGTFEAA